MRMTTNTQHLRAATSRLLAVGMAWIGIGIICGPTRAQQSPKNPVARQEQQVSIDAKKTSLLAVVESLLKQAHADYTFDSQLMEAPIGAIHLTKVPLSIALEIALKASGKPATYRQENGIYMVVAKTEEPVLQPGMGTGTSGRTAEAQEPRINASFDGTPGDPHISMMVVNTNLYDALKLLFGAARAQYTLDPSLRSIYVTVNLNQPFRNALETLLRAGSQKQLLTYRLENDVYSIVPKTDDFAAPIAEPSETSRVKMQLTNADLHTALKLLFAQAHMQFTLDPALKNYFVTVDLDLPFQQALEALLRGAGQNLTYKVVNGVYSVVPKP